MSGSDGCCNSLVVVKLGGSVLSNEKAYRRAAEFLRRRLDAEPAARFVAVVSAQEGDTDFLERTARSIASSPSARALHLLWSTGEIRSVALLTLHLEALGVSAAGLNVQETGLRLGGATWGDSCGDAGRVSLSPVRLRAALADHRVAVAPGFVATDAHEGIVALGRGGSDLTAVLLAGGLGAGRCELVKDVPGYFTADPHLDSAARHLPALTFAEALELADRGCDLVQRQALEAAARARLLLVVRSLNETAPVSIVSEAAARSSEWSEIETCHPEPVTLSSTSEGPAFCS